MICWGPGPPMWIIVCGLSVNKGDNMWTFREACASKPKLTSKKRVTLQDQSRGRGRGRGRGHELTPELKVGYPNIPMADCQLHSSVVPGRWILCHRSHIQATPQPGASLHFSWQRGHWRGPYLRTVSKRAVRAPCPRMMPWPMSRRCSLLCTGTATVAAVK